MAEKGKLYLIPASLGGKSFSQTFPQYNIDIIMHLDVFIVEDLRTARRFLRKAGFKKSFDDVT